MIDKYTHLLDMERAVYDTIMLDNAVKLARDWASARGDDTLILVVADHTHPIGLVGTIEDDMASVPNVPMRERVRVYGRAGFPNYPAPDAEGYPARVDVSRRLALFSASLPDYYETFRPKLDNPNDPTVAGKQPDTYVANERYKNVPGAVLRLGNLPAMINPTCIPARTWFSPPPAPAASACAGRSTIPRSSASWPKRSGSARGRRRTYKRTDLCPASAVSFATHAVRPRLPRRRRAGKPAGCRAFGLVRTRLRCGVAALALLVTIPLPVPAAPAVTVETAAQEIVGIASQDRCDAARARLSASRSGAVSARRRQPWLAPRPVAAPDHGGPDLCLHVELAASARLHGRAAAASRLRRDRRAMVGDLRRVRQSRLLPRRVDIGRGYRGGDRLPSRPTRGRARSCSPDRVLGGRLGIDRSRKQKPGGCIRGDQFCRRARRRASAGGQLHAGASGRGSGALWRNHAHSRASGSMRPTTRSSRPISAAGCSMPLFAPAGEGSTLRSPLSAATGIGSSALRTAAPCGSRTIEKFLATLEP